MYKREAENAVKEVNKTFKVLLVTGPRQVGKTTLLKSLMPRDMSYVTLDDETLREQAQKDPALFIKEHPAPLMIDEVQYAPSLLSYIKIAVDASDKTGQYWLTGSQQFYLMNGVSESLAGRVGIVNLNSLTYAEINRNMDHVPFAPEDIRPPKTSITVDALYEAIFKGGMPRFFEVENLSRDLYFQSYIDTYIARDIQNLNEVGNIKAFMKLLVSVASRTGEQLNYTSLANDAGVSVPTAQSWFSILVTMGLVYLLEPYLSTELQRVTHMPKIVFMDTGLACYLAGWESAKTLQMDSKAGAYLETYIISEIIKSYNARGIRPNISYYRDKDKNEIDLVFYKNNKVYPFEIKKNATPKKDMIKNFDKINTKTKELGNGGLICLYEKMIRLDENNYVIPVESVIE